MSTALRNGHAPTRRKPAATTTSTDYRELFDNLPVGLYRTTPAGEIVEANRELLRIFGYASLEELRSTSRDSNYAEPRTRRRILNQLARRGQVVGCECMVRRRDGSTLWVREDARAVRDEAGQVAFIEGVITDISQRRQAEDELRRSQERVNSIFSSSAVAMAVFEADGRMSLMVGKAFETAGIDPASMIGRHMDEILQSRPDLREHFRRALAGEAHTAVLPILDETHQVDFLPVFDERREVTRVFSVGIDISDRVEAERRLAQMADHQQQMSEYLTLLLESTGDGVCSVDGEGRCTFVNRAGATMLGYLPAELMGRKLDRLITTAAGASEDTVSQIQRLADAIRTRRRQRIECTVLRRDGSSLDAEITTYPLAEGEPKHSGAVVVIRDVGERKRAEDALRESEAKSRFLATMSHELRTPLNSILGFSQLLVDDRVGKLNDRQQRYISNIQTSGRHLLALINDVLDLAKVEAGRMPINLEEVTIATVVEDAIAKIRPLAETKSLSLEQVESPPLQTQADRRRLEQVLLNLLSNAVRFTPPGGCIKVSMSAEGDRAVITVEDTGVGFAPDQAERIFEEFTQLDSGRGRDHEGTGLGLALSRRLARLMYGDIRASSEPGAGSQFDVLLPLGNLSTPR